MSDLKIVYTPLGKGKIVYRLGDGSLVVEFEHGGGQIFRESDLFPTKNKVSIIGKTTTYNFSRIRDSYHEQTAGY